MNPIIEYLQSQFLSLSSLEDNGRKALSVSILLHSFQQLCSIERSSGPFLYEDIFYVVRTAVLDEELSSTSTSTARNDEIYLSLVFEVACNPISQEIQVSEHPFYQVKEELIGKEGSYLQAVVEKLKFYVQQLPDSSYPPSASATSHPVIDALERDIAAYLLLSNNDRNNTGKLIPAREEHTFADASFPPPPPSPSTPSSFQSPGSHKSQQSATATAWNSNPTNSSTMHMNNNLHPTDQEKEEGGGDNSNESGNGKNGYWNATLHSTYTTATTAHPSTSASFSSNHHPIGDGDDDGITSDLNTGYHRNHDIMSSYDMYNNFPSSNNNNNTTPNTATTATANAIPSTRYPPPPSSTLHDLYNPSTASSSISSASYQPQIQISSQEYGNTNYNNPPSSYPQPSPQNSYNQYAPSPSSLPSSTRNTNTYPPRPYNSYQPPSYPQSSSYNTPRPYSSSTNNNSNAYSAPYSHHQPPPPRQQYTANNNNSNYSNAYPRPYTNHNNNNYSNNNNNRYNNNNNYPNTHTGTNYQQNHQQHHQQPYNPHQYNPTSNNNHHNNHHPQYNQYNNTQYNHHTNNTNYPNPSHHQQPQQAQQYGSTMSSHPTAYNNNNINTNNNNSYYSDTTPSSRGSGISTATSLPPPQPSSLGLPGSSPAISAVVSSMSAGPPHTGSSLSNAASAAAIPNSKASHPRLNPLLFNAVLQLRAYNMDVIFPQQLHDKVLVCLYVALKALPLPVVHREVIHLAMILKESGYVAGVDHVSKTKVRGVLAILKQADMVLKSGVLTGDAVLLQVDPQIHNFDLFRDRHDQFLHRYMTENMTQLPEEMKAEILWMIDFETRQKRLETLDVLVRQLEPIAANEIGKMRDSKYHNYMGHMDDGFY